eukprot:5206186-Amphidinium_carterae.1
MIGGHEVTVGRRPLEKTTSARGTHVQSELSPILVAVPDSNCHSQMPYKQLGLTNAIVNQTSSSSSRSSSNSNSSGNSSSSSS